jgi:hypothetical protein
MLPATTKTISRKKAWASSKNVFPIRSSRLRPIPDIFSILEIQYKKALEEKEKNCNADFSKQLTQGKIEK